MPMMLSRLFLWTAEDNSKRYQQLFDRFKGDLWEINGLKEQQLTLMSDSGGYRVRIEFFCQTFDFSDIILPRIPLNELIWVGKHDRIEKHMMSEIRAILAPLRDLQLHIERCESRKIYGIRMWDELVAGTDDGHGADRMTTLIYCVEKAVQFMNIIRNSRYGAITRRIWDHLDACRENSTLGENDIFFGIPEDCVIKVSDQNESKMCLVNANVIPKTSSFRSGSGGQNVNGVDNQSLMDVNEEAFALAPDDSGNEEEVPVPAQTNQYHLIKSTLYSYKRVDLSVRLTDADLKKLPTHTQTLGVQMTKDSILPYGEEHLKAKIIQAFFEFTESEKERNRRSKYDIPKFQKRGYRFGRCKTKTKEEIEGLYKKLGTFCWDGYDASWMIALKQRKWYREKNHVGYKNNAVLSLPTFPTTKQSFDLWHESQGREGSMTLLQSEIGADWKSGTAKITTPTDLYNYCFAPSEKALKGRWNRFLSVRLYKMIISIFRQIYNYLRKEKDYDVERLTMWTHTSFIEYLFNSMDSCRVRATGDTSMFLVWDLTNDDKSTWDWRRIRPILIMPATGTPERSLTTSELPPTLPPNQKLVDYMFPFRTNAEKRKQSGTGGQKDRFYRILAREYGQESGTPGSYVLLNEIIGSRILFAMRSINKFVSRNCCAQKLIFDTGTKVLGKIFTYSEKGFDEKIKDLKKKFKKNPEGINYLTEFAKQNFSLWDKDENDRLKIFKDTLHNETMMKDYMNDKNFTKVMYLAHRGIITESFLDLLIELRDRNEDIRDESDKVILKELIKHFESIK